MRIERSPSSRFFVIAVFPSQMSSIMHIGNAMNREREVRVNFRANRGGSLAFEDRARDKTQVESRILVADLATIPAA